MIFHVDMAFALELIAFAMGFLLLVAIKQSQMTCKATKAAAFFVIIASVLSMLCTVYFASQYRNAGMFEPRAPMMPMQGMGQTNGMGMMGNMPEPPPTMKK